MPLLKLKSNNLKCIYSSLFYIKKSHANLNQFKIIRRKISIDQALINWNTFLINSSPVIKCQEVLVNLHSSLNIPWYVEIIGVSLFLRACLFPLSVYERQQLAKYENLNLELKEHAKEINEDIRKKLVLRQIFEKEAKILYKRKIFLKKKQLILDKNVHPFKRVILILTQVPIWIIMSCSIGNLCLRSEFIKNDKILEMFAHAYPELKNQGMLWITDLTSPDPYFIMPFLVGSAFLFNVQHAVWLRRRNDIKETLLTKILTNSLRMLCPVFMMITANIPVGVSLYWFTTIGTGAIQNVVFTYPSFRKRCKIPVTEKEIYPVEFNKNFNKIIHKLKLK